MACVGPSAEILFSLVALGTSETRISDREYSARGAFRFLFVIMWSPQGNGEEFSKSLAALCDYYVNDAFGTAHRAHASTVGMTSFVERKVRRGFEEPWCLGR